MGVMMWGLCACAMVSFERWNWHQSILPFGVHGPSLSARQFARVYGGGLHGLCWVGTYAHPVYTVEVTATW